MSSKRFIVISSGQVLEDFTVEQVAENLGKLYKKPADKMIETLISGESRKVKSVSTRAQAKSKCAHLSSLGLRCSYTETGKDEHDDIDMPSMYTRASYIDDTPPPKPSSKSSAKKANDGIAEAENFDEDHTQDSQEHSEMFDEAIFDDVLAQVKSGKLKKFLLLFALPLLLLIGVAFVGYFAYTLFFNNQASASFEEVESALFAVNEPAVAFYTNMRQLKKLAELAGHDNLRDDSAVAMASTQFLESFAGNSYLFDQTDFIAASLDIDTTDSTLDKHWMTVLLGSYDAALVQQELSKFYELSNMANGIYRLDKSTKLVDGFSCPLTESEQENQSLIYLHISEDKLSFGSQAKLVTALQSKLSGGSRGGNSAARLAEWQSYRNGALVATRVFMPKSIEQNMIANLAVSSISPNVPFETVGARLAPALLSRGVELSLDGYGPNSRELENAKIKVERAMRSALNKSESLAPSAAKLISRVKVSSDEEVTISVVLDNELLEDVEGLVNELFGELTLGSQSPVAREQLETNPWDYSKNTQLLEVVSRTNSSFESYSPLFTRDGVAIFLESMGVKIDRGIGLGASNEMQVSLKASRQTPQGFQSSDALSWDQSGVLQSLMVTDVLDASGKQLIADEKCRTTKFGELKNHQANHASTLNNSRIETTKSVRLLAGSKIDEIKQLKGWYELSVPTTVRKIDLSMNGERKVQWDGGSLRLTGIRDGSISYEIDGDEKGLVNLRGFNEKNQALTSYSSVSTGQKIIKTMAGKVAKVEVTIATKWDNQRFEFDITSLRPRRLNETAGARVTEEVTPFSKKNRRKFNSALSIDRLNEEARANIDSLLARQGYSLDRSIANEIGRGRSKSAHILMKHDADSNWHKQLQGIIIVPFDPGILINPNSLRLELEVDGKTYPAINPSFSVSSNNGRYQPSFRLGKRAYLIGNFSIDLSNFIGQISLVSGVISYSFPTAFTKSTVNLSQAEILRAVKLRGIDYSGFEALTSYVVDKRISNLYSATLLTAGGSELRAKLSKDKNDETILVFSSDEIHRKIDLFQSKSSFDKREGFSLTPVYQ